MSERMFDIIPKLGHEIVAWDEEGLVRFPDRFYYQRRLSAKALRNVKILFAWGADDARSFRAFEGYHGCPIHVTGNPRVDLMRPEIRDFFDREAEILRARYGDFVLVNTNFSGLNHFHDGLSELKWNLEPKDGEVKDPFMAGRAAFRNTILGHFQQMIPALSEVAPGLQDRAAPASFGESPALEGDFERPRNVEVVKRGQRPPVVDREQGAGPQRLHHRRRGRDSRDALGRLPAGHRRHLRHDPPQLPLPPRLRSEGRPEDRALDRRR